MQYKQAPTGLFFCGHCGEHAPKWEHIAIAKRSIRVVLTPVLDTVLEVGYSFINGSKALWHRSVKQARLT